MSILIYTLLITALAMVAMWCLSLLLRNAAIVDSYWGPGFLVIASIAAASGTGSTARTGLILTLVAIWSLRLGGYLTWRNWGKPEDYRYGAMRTHHGSRFWWVSFLTVFTLQGVLMWLISLPLQAAVLTSTPVELGWLDYVGVLLWAVGFTFEAIGDAQLARFKGDPANVGKVLDRGVWAWTRHPNYFGETLIWWGYGLIALATPYGPWLLLSPVLMTFLLLKVSGVAMLERDIGDRRPGYADYMRRTSAFWPRPPLPRSADNSTGVQ
ncbi:MAG: DUF1295 domain-containing protein [Acidobacteria bacterium]|nr:DUF1295 domain-containing protein [Acidobacteriota bacterium]